MATIHSFEELDIWKKAQAYAVMIFNLTDLNEKIRKDFSFKDQIKRAALSISNNIAEGFEYNNNNDFSRFLRIAKGSCGEVRNCLIFSNNVGYTNYSDNKELIDSLNLLGKQIGKLMSYIHQKRIKTSLAKTRNP
ncbi:MAG: four helix bundle protein [Ferruginibacter sp.]